MSPRSRADWRMVGDLVGRAGAHLPPYTEEAIEMTTKVRQRPAWTFPSRWIPAVGPLSSAVRPLLVAALLGLALVGGLLAWAASRPAPPPRAWANGPIAWGVVTGTYVAVKSGGAQVLTIDPVTGASAPASGFPQRPFAFSPDGTRLAFFVSLDRGRVTRLVVSAPDGRAMAVVGEYESDQVDSMAWSPDGRWLVAADHAYDGRAASRFMLFAADGSGMRDLDLGSLPRGAPSWAPTSDRLVFAGESPAAPMMNGWVKHVSRALYTVAIDGVASPVLLAEGEVTSIYTAVDAEPAWSPDGEWIAYVRWTGTARRDPPDTTVHLVRADGTDDHALALPQGWNTAPTWSPDGSALLARNQVDGAAGQEAHLLVVSIDGRPARRIGPPSTGGWLYHFAWSPDGRLVVANVETSANSGEVGAALVDVAANRWRVVAGEGVSPAFAFSWRPVEQAAQP